MKKLATILATVLAVSMLSNAALNSVHIAHAPTAIVADSEGHGGGKGSRDSEGHGGGKGGHRFVVEARQISA